MAAYGKTIFELTSGGQDNRGIPARYFGPHRQCDAYVRAAELIVAIDGDVRANSGWVHLKRLPDSIYPEGLTLMSWTKTSNETPTTEGALTPEAA